MRFGFVYLSLALATLSCGRPEPRYSEAGETCWRTAHCAPTLRCVDFVCLEEKKAKAAVAARRGLGARFAPTPLPSLQGGAGAALVPAAGAGEPPPPSMAPPTAPLPGPPPATDDTELKPVIVEPPPVDTPAPLPATAGEPEEGEAPQEH